MLELSGEIFAPGVASELSLMCLALDAVEVESAYQAESEVLGFLLRHFLLFVWA
jgi:hypothetical protein